MKKIITLTLGIILFSFLFASSNKIFATEIALWLDSSMSCEASVIGTDVSIKVWGVETYLTKHKEYDSLQIFIFRKSWGVDWAEVSSYDISTSGTYTFSTASSRSEKGSWSEGNYEVEINTPSRGSQLTICLFKLPAEDNEEGAYTYDLCGGNKDCLDCIGGGGSWTALGCLPTNKPATFVNSLLKFSIGIGGGIAFLLIIFGGFQIILSSGNPERVKAGKEMITSAIAGLLLIIFAVFILKLIGVDILKIPGFK